MMYNGDDMAAYMFPGKRYSAMRDHIAINFKTLERDGLLLHSEGAQGDVLTLELRNARLYLHISLGEARHMDSVPLTDSTTWINCRGGK